MGAAGEAFICMQGHLFARISEDLWWGYPKTDEGQLIFISSGLDERSKELKEDGCPCGQPTYAVIPHYGDINDCIPFEKGEERKRLVPIKEDILFVQIQDAVDEAGNPIQGVYRKLTLEGYDISQIPIEFLVNHLTEEEPEMPESKES